MERLPSDLIIEEILQRLDLETLFIVACVNNSLRFAVDTQLLPFLSSVSLRPSFIPDADTLSLILRRCGGGGGGLKRLTLNCQRLNEPSLAVSLGPEIRELELFCCSLISPRFLSSVAQRCPFIRELTIEMADQGSPDLFRSNLEHMLSRCEYLECLCLKIRGTEVGANPFQSIDFFLPKTIKVLKLKPMLEEDAIRLTNKLGAGGNLSISVTDDFGIPVSPMPFGFRMQCLSLVLDVISDRLLLTVANCLPLLVELDLEDRPRQEVPPFLDFTNGGLQSLGSCRNLTGLSLVRGRQNYQASFKRVNDMGMFLLSESCKDLQTVRLSGFSKVSDAGYASLLHSCQKLKKFEVRNAMFLSDLAFHDLVGVPCVLVEVRLLSCSLITSETVKKLASCSELEVLDLCGCKSIANSCLSFVSSLGRLTMLNLSGADITDSGLSVLGQGNTPITHLSFRGCKRVTDKGISLLLCGGGAIERMLSSLDLGYMPGISDIGINQLASAGRQITELCIRCCFNVTDSSLQTLASKSRLKDGNKQIQQLDIFNCTGLSASVLKFLERPFFRGLHWIGIGQTRLARKGDPIITKIFKERPWLSLCMDGCEMGCRDGWQFHGPVYRWLT